MENKGHETKSAHITFTMNRGTCLPVSLNNIQIPQADVVRCLGMHLDRRLTWKNHIFTKRKQLGLQLHKLYRMLHKKSKLSLENKILLYKCIIKPIWTYGIQLWGTASLSNIEIIQRFQSKILRTVVDAPWFVTNEILHHDLQIPTVREEATRFVKRHMDRLNLHPNSLANQLTKPIKTRRLKRKIPQDLLSDKRREN